MFIIVIALPRPTLHLTIPYIQEVIVTHSYVCYVLCSAHFSSLCCCRNSKSIIWRSIKFHSSCFFFRSFVGFFLSLSFSHKCNVMCQIHLWIIQFITWQIQFIYMFSCMGVVCANSFSACGFFAICIATFQNLEK